MLRCAAGLEQEVQAGERGQGDPASHCTRTAPHTQALGTVWPGGPGQVAAGRSLCLDTTASQGMTDTLPT